MALTAFLNRPRVAPALLAIPCLSALETALASQYGGGLQPCVLCLYQRYAYGVALAFAGLAFLAAAHALGRRILLMLPDLPSPPAAPSPPSTSASSRSGGRALRSATRRNFRPAPRSSRCARSCSTSPLRPATWCPGNCSAFPWRASTSWPRRRSEEHTSELQSLMRISYAVFCLKKNNTIHHILCSYT